MTLRQKLAIGTLPPLTPDVGAWQNLWTPMGLQILWTSCLAMAFCSSQSFQPSCPVPMSSSSRPPPSAHSSSLTAGVHTCLGAQAFKWSRICQSTLRRPALIWRHPCPLRQSRSVCARKIERRCGSSGQSSERSQRSLRTRCRWDALVLSGKETGSRA